MKRKIRFEEDVNKIQRAKFGQNRIEMSAVGEFVDDSEYRIN